MVAPRRSARLQLWLYVVKNNNDAKFLALLGVQVHEVYSLMSATVMIISQVHLVTTVTRRSVYVRMLCCLCSELL